jgi:hypothetical protein
VSYLEPDRELDLEEDISAIKSSVRSHVGGAGKGEQSYESDDSSEEEAEEEDAHERLMRAKDSDNSPTPVSENRRQTRGSAAKAKGVVKGGCGLRGVNHLCVEG